MTRRFVTIAALWIQAAAAGVLVGPAAAVAQQQDVVLAMRGPRFLQAATAKAAPVEVDVRSSEVLRQVISLDMDRATVGDVLAAIERQTGIKFIYSRNVIAVGRQVRVRAQRITVAGALTEILIDAGVDVLLKGNHLALVQRPPAERRRAGAIVGRVVDAKSHQPVVGAEVFLQGTRWHAAVDTTGRYRLAELDAGTYTLAARRLGYVKQSRKITVRAEGVDTADFVLDPAPVALDELVTTATGQQRRRDIGNSITTISADSVLRTAPVRSLTDLLKNRVPGMTLQHTSGAPGDPARIRLRGLGSVMRSNDPVVIVDGVRIYATQSAARSGNLTNLVPAIVAPNDGNVPAPAPSPLDQIDPNIIEKIEVFKGASAATLYGADAANGVIVITTKKGKPGRTEWHASFEHGRTRTLGQYPTAYYPWGHGVSSGGSAFCPLPVNGNIRCIQDSVVRFQALNVLSSTVLGQGHRNAASLSASGGTMGLTYTITGSYSEEIGLLKLPALEVERFRTAFNREVPSWMQRPHEFKTWSVTSSVRALLGRTADVTLSASLRRTQQQRSSLEDQLPALAATYVDTVNKLYYPAGGSSLASGFFGGSPTTVILKDYYTRTTASSVGFSTGLNANWRPFSWFTATSQAGLNVIPREDQLLLSAGLASPQDGGTFRRATGQSLVSTFNLQGTVQRPLGWGFRFETNLGANLNTETTADVGIGARGLVPGTSTIDLFSTTTAYEKRISSSIFGWYIEPQVKGQRISLSTGIRLDGGSAYGARVTRTGGGIGGLLGLPKLNGSWVISEEPWFPFGALFSSLRLRGAYGQAQVQPGPADRLRIYKYSGLVQPAVVLKTLGNTQLRPERSTEVEGGFDADLLDRRLSLEFTTYRKVQVDALMPLQLPPSAGGGGSLMTVMTNIGTIRNTGVELTLELTPMRSSALTWTNRLGYTSNRNELVELGRGVVPNRNEGIVAGYPVGGRWDRPILGYSDINGDGVLQMREVLVGDSAVFMGQLYPAYQMSLHTNVSLLNNTIGISAGFSYDAGATQLDQTARANWVMSRALTDRTTPLSQQAAVLTSIANLPELQTSYGVIQEVSTFRFQTFSINYRLPASVARRLRAQGLELALQADNLALHSSYGGKDPDVNAWGPGEGIVDAGQLAQPTTWQLRIDLRY